MSSKVKISYFIDPVSMGETGKVPYQQHRTRIIRLRQIFTDNQRASASSAQSMFHSNPSAFICVHPRLIFDREMRGVSAA